MKLAHAIKSNLFFVKLIICLGICINVYAQDEPVYDVQGKRNPFAPLMTSEGGLLNVDKEVSKGDLSLEGVLFDKSGPSYAIVNGLVLEAGNQVDGYLVSRIEEDRVVFVKDEQTKEITLKEEEE